MQSTTTAHIYTVSRLNQTVKQLLEESLFSVWVEGEISNFATPGSGHWYFSLKDNVAQVRCAMFRGNQRKLGFTPKDGMHVLIKARVSVYEARGEYQLIAEDMEERGEGKLKREFELLKKKLEAKGLFDPARKRPLPLFPKKIGVITSATGAAIRDILTIFKRRMPLLPIIIYPTLVQGKEAAPAIVNAIEKANSHQQCDVLILARGGGSLEDLWPFNEEMVAIAIANSSLPIITGVGHEVDFTIADFVADRRAPTPSAAAEIATPDQAEILEQLTRQYARFLRAIKRDLTDTRQSIAMTEKFLVKEHPKRRLMEKMQTLDLLSMNLIQLEKTKLMEVRGALSTLSASLNAISPLATLGRGFAIARTADQCIIDTVEKVKIGDKIEVILKEGRLGCAVTEIC